MKKRITGVMPIKDQWHSGKPASSLTGLGALAMANECKRLFSAHDHARIGVYVPRSVILALEGQDNQPLAEAVNVTSDWRYAIHKELFAPHFLAYDPGPVTPVQRNYLLAVLWTGRDDTASGVNMIFHAAEESVSSAFTVSAPMTNTPILSTLSLTNIPSGWQRWSFFVNTDSAVFFGVIKVWAVYIWSTTAEVQTGVYHYTRP